MRRRRELADEMSPRLRVGVVLVTVAAGLVNLALLLLHRSALGAPPAYLVINLVGCAGPSWHPVWSPWRIDRGTARGG